MKRLVKSLSVFVLLFVLAFVVVANVKADEEPVLTVAPGASMRTWGDAQGLRFIAELDSLTDVTERGFYVAKGELSVDETVALNKKFPVSVGEEEYNKFSAVIYNIPEESYTQDITVVAYYVVNDVEKFADAAVTRNIAEVAVAAKATGNETELVQEVVESIENNYVRTYTDVYGNIVVTSSLKEFEVENMEAEFIDDLNAVYNTTLTTSSTIGNYFTVLSSSEKDDLTDSVLYKFFVSNEETSAKWGWVIELMKEVSSDVHVKNQVNALLSKKPIYDTDVHAYPLHYGRHLSYSIYNFFNRANDYTGWGQTSFVSESQYSSIYEYSNVYADLGDYELVKIGDTITLPAAVEKTGYTWQGWNDGTVDYAAESEYVVAEGTVKLTANLKINEYNLKFFSNGEELTDLASTFTVLDTVEVAPLEDQPGLTFVGWYDNEDFEGDKVSEISEGTADNVNLYACWEVGFSSLVVDGAWAGKANGEKVTFNELEYTIGSDAHATIADAVALAQNNATITVAAGTYAENFTIARNGITLVGPNVDVDPNGSVERKEEAVLTGVITLGAYVENTTIKGFKLTGNAEVTVTKLGDQTSKLDNNNGFNFEYNYVDKGESTTPVINFNESNRVYNHNVVVANNYFTGGAHNSTENTAIVYFNNNINIYVTDNVFESVTTHAVAIYDTKNGIGAGGNIDVQRNKFVDVVGSALWVNYTSLQYQSNSYIKVIDNYFENVVASGCAPIDFEDANTSYNLYSEITLIKNTFKECVKCYWSPKIQAAVTGEAKNRGGVFQYNVVYFASGFSYVASGSWYYFVLGYNLFCSADGTECYVTPSANGFPTKSLQLYLDDNNFASFEDYEAAIANLQ